MGSWDRGIKFEEAYNQIISHIKSIKGKLKYATRYRKRLLKELLYDYILITALVNGLRISEAVYVFKTFASSRKRIIRFKPAKKIKDDKRIAYVPEVIPDYDINMLKDLIYQLNSKFIVSRISHYCINTFGFTTHTLRYAFITKFGSLYGPQVAAAVTRHTKLKMILHYTQKRVAEEILVNFIKNIKI